MSQPRLPAAKTTTLSLSQRLRAWLQSGESAKHNLPAQTLPPQQTRRLRHDQPDRRGPWTRSRGSVQAPR